MHHCAFTIQDIAIMNTQERRIAIYPGTFDPITNGHVDIVKRASRLFDQVVVAVADNVNKNCFFTVAERVTLAQAVLKNFTNVEVRGFKCLLTHLTAELATNIVIRGLRALSDFEYEFQLAMMNRHINNDFETIFLTPSEQYLFTSSSLVREIAHYHGDVSQFVDPIVAEALQQKMRGA